ncbi:hypothetical protein SASPL_137082 [Salvia splendens]|uniref:Uncharacterized protein n=1 Tax=Salvia splendens TaxID=180675 RepID=A0A8X8ZCM1_SALSN|nr:hypothetical protein SASPL_137082 [Salvia splendens]
MPMERILHLLYIRPRTFLVKSDTVMKSVEKAIEIGVPLTSIAFVYAVEVFNYTSEGMWEVKLQTLRDLGFSDNGIVSMFRKHHITFSASGNNLKKKIEFLLATGKFNIASIVACLAALGCSIEKRLEPRMQILRLLESRNLIEKPYYDEIGEECIIKKFVTGKKRVEVVSKCLQSRAQFEVIVNRLSKLRRLEPFCCLVVFLLLLLNMSGGVSAESRDIVQRLPVLVQIAHPEIRNFGKKDELMEKQTQQIQPPVGGSEKARKKKMPSPQELVTHYEKQGMSTQEASLKVIGDLQGALFRMISANNKRDDSNSSPQVISAKLDAVYARVAQLETKLDYKPSYPQALALGVASASFWNGALELWKNVRRATSSDPST